MFERIAVDFLNKFFGDYFENIDPSHLNVSLWKGDVSLSDIYIKTTALDSLKMPFQVISGKVGKLMMSLPWKTIYTSPVELTLKDLFLVTVPSPPSPYNPEAEEQAAIALKMKLLEEIEDTRHSMQLREGGEVVTEGSSYKEKLMMLIVRNVQIRIESIHVRYEDKVTSPQNPFSTGFVLKSLYVQTTDATWTPNFVHVPTPTIHKIVSLVGLGFYLNSGESNLMTQRIRSKNKMITTLQAMITTENALRYMIGPIMTELKLQHTSSPENLQPPFSFPKIKIEVVMNELALGISNVQFNDIIHFADGVNFLTQARKWRKLRPKVTGFKGNAKIWWRFAYACIRVEIQRRRQTWIWGKIKEHRVLCKKYYDALYKKNILKTPSPQLDIEIKECEVKLDNFNIVLVRKQIEMRKERQDRIENERRRHSGWLGTLLGWDMGAQNLEEVVGTLDDSWNDEEKRKLDLAIGYTSGQLPGNFPKEYVEFKLDFCLKKLNVLVKEIQPGSTVTSPGHSSTLLRLKLDNFVNALEYRPVNNGLKMDWKMGDIEVFGISNGDKPAAAILKAKKEKSEHFFEVCYETSPLDSDAEKRIRLKGKALEIVYHAKTTKQVLKSFTPSSEVQFSRIQADAMTKLNEFKEVSSASLRRMVHTRGELLIEIDFVAPYFIIPQNGDLDEGGNILIIDLGELQVRTDSHEPRKPGHNIVAPQVTSGSSKQQPDENGLTPEFLQLYYETYFVQLNDFRVLLALRGEDYKVALQDKNGLGVGKKSTDLLRFKEFLLTVNESLLVSNPTAPKFIATASLPLVDFEVTEERLTQLLRLLISLPLPKSNNLSENIYDAEPKQDVSLEEIDKVVVPADFDPENSVQFTNLILDIRLEAIRIHVSRPQGINGDLKPLLDFELKKSRTKFCYKSFGTTIEFRIGGLTLCALSHSLPDAFGPLYLIQTPTTVGNQKPLLNIRIFVVTPSCPKSVANPIKLQITNEVSSVDIILHQEVLLTLFSFADAVISQITKEFEKYMEATTRIPIGNAAITGNTKKDIIAAPGPTVRRNSRKYKGNPMDILLKLETKMDSLTIQLSSERKNIVKLAVVKLNVSIQKTPYSSDFKLQLMDLNCLNLDSNSSYKKILTVEGDKMVFAHVISYSGEQSGGSNAVVQPDLRITAQTGSPKIVCLGYCFNDIIKFGDKFNSVTKAIKEASATAEENVKQAFGGHDIKILLDIQIGAPKIVLPRNANSTSALMADLGNLSFQNTLRFAMADSGKTKSKALIDEMSIHLKSVKLSRILVNLETQKMKAEYSLLEPVSFLGNLHRNLSSDWYTKLPAVTFIGKVDSTVLRISDDDYEMALTAMLHFLAGFEDAKNTRKSRPQYVRNEIGRISAEIPSTQVAVTPGDFDVLSISIKLTFAELGIILYQGSSMINEESPQNFKNLNCLAKFSIADIRAAFVSWGDLKSNFEASIGVIGFKDCRESAGAISDLIQRKTLSNDPVLKFSMKFSIKPGVVKFCQMDFHMENLTLIVCLDYLAQVTLFFAAADYTVPKYERGDSAIQMRRLSDSINESFKKLQKESLVINLSPGELELVLVEDMNTVHTNAVILKFETGMEISFISQEVYGTARANLLVNTCNYSPAHRNATLAEVCSPIEMNVSFVKSKASTSSIVEVDISDVFIRLSAGTVELFTKISKSWNSAAEIAEKEARKEVDNSSIWDTKSVDDLDYWFLSIEGAEKYLQMDQSTLEIEDDISTYSEHLLVKPISIVVTFEVGMDATTTPLLLLDTVLDLHAFNWSRQILFSGSLQFAMAYNNTKFGTWEYLIEPVEVGQYGSATHKSWEATFVISKSSAATRHRTGESNIAIVQPNETEDQSKVYYIISLQSNDILEMTLSQTAFEVLENLGDAFGEATKSLVSQRQILTSPYVIVNETGSQLTVDLRDSSFLFARGGESHPGEIVVAPGAKVNLKLDNIARARYSILREQEGIIERRLKISIPDFQFSDEVPVNRAEGRFYPFESEARNGLFCNVRAKDCSVVVTLRGLYKIENHLNIAMNIFSQEIGKTTLTLIGNVGGMTSWSVPIKTNKKSYQFFFAPRDHVPVVVPVVWTPLLTSNPNSENSSIITCKPRSGNGPNVTVKVMNEIQSSLLKNTSRRTMTSRVCCIHLRAPLILINSLPTSLIFSPEETTVEAGNLLLVTSLGSSDEGEFDFSLKMNYEEQDLTCPVSIKRSTPDLSAWPFKSGDKNVLHLGIQKEISDGIVTLQVYCPFWMINLTGLLLSYKEDDNNNSIKLHHTDHKGPLMFSSDGTNFFSKKKGSLKCSALGEWSEKFYLDVTGSSILVTSKSPRKDFQVEVTVSLSKVGLTKLITFKPRFEIVNKCSYSLLIQEIEFKDDKIHFDENRCIPFWPRSKNTMINVNIFGTNELSKSVNYARIQNTLLKIKNRHGGTHVNVHVATTRTTITFREYVPGQAPVLLINATENVSLDFGEIGGEDKINLSPMSCQLFTWSEPAGQRTLTWSPTTTQKSSDFKDPLLVDGTGQFKTKISTGEDTDVHWVSFLEGFQRILFFTSNQKLVSVFTNARMGEMIQMQVVLALSGFGLSLVDSETCREILYLRISSTGIQWEMAVEGIPNLYIPFETDISGLVETAYLNYIDAKTTSNMTEALFTINPDLQVNFAEMMTVNPKGRSLHRSSVQPGIWFDLKKLPLSTQIQLKVNRIQIDNQLSDCTFRRLLTPVPPPKSVVAENDAAKPFINVSLMQRSTAHSRAAPFIYCSVLVQEFHVRLDMGLINAIVSLFKTPGGSKAELMVKNFQKDFGMVNRGTEEYFEGQMSNSGQKYFFEKLHLSPIKLHLSFSVTGAAQDKDAFLPLLLQSIGVALTDVQDIVFRLACLELKHLQLSNAQLGEEIRSHYISQFMKQFYSYVLGLDLLGNPIGLVTGVTEGIEAFFYEPFQGAIQGPAEFAEGLSLGVKSLVGHTLGGAAGALSKITGSFGKGMAFLTMDDNYQKKRQEVIAQRSREGLVSYARNFIKAGIVDTVTGVVTSPIKGAQAEGFSGFGKGLLKGTLGLVARPIAGAADLATGTLDALQRAAQPKDSLVQARPPRNIEPDTNIVPYVRQTAEGILILKELKAERQDLSEEEYVAHIVVGYSKNQVLLITSHRAFYLTLRDIFGASVIEWEHKWEDLASVPDITEKERGLSFHLKGAETGFGILRSLHEKRLFIPIPDARICVWILTKIEEAMRKHERGKAS